MDFSSVPRAVESLFRREPALDDSTLTAARSLETFQDEDWSGALETLLKVTERWEPLAVGLYTATQILQKHGSSETVYVDGPRVPSTQEGDDVKDHLPVVQDPSRLCSLLHDVCLEHLEHKEPRVRTLVAQCVGAYLSTDTSHAAAMHERLTGSIREHIVQGRDQIESYSRSSTGALDDTTGWRALETSWLCLASLIQALGKNYFALFPLQAEEEYRLQDCQYSCVTHVNRHVRAAALAVLEQWVKSAESEAQLLAKTGALRATCKSVLKPGLADNWSQVRMAASVLCRVMWLILLKRSENEPDDLQDVFAAILPRMCLNRFYLAQGVKLYSHETWKLVFPEGGMEQVVRYLPAIVRYYVKMCDADNHVVREAACQAIAELADRVGSDEEHRPVLQEHVHVLLQALLMCFHDESWPVRDEACLACGTLCRSFPEDCRPEFKTLWERWTEQLTDQIWSVRQDAAVALADALVAYGEDIWEPMKNDLIPKILPAARDQPAMTREEYKAHINSAEAHTNSQLYSCGSLAPKLKKKAGAGRIGCSNCGIDRPKAPWEATDGCIYLIRELCFLSSVDAPPCAVTFDDNVLLPLLTELADVCRVQHFPQADELRTTLWRQLPPMASALGKQRFKRLYLEIFLDLLCRDLQSRTASQLAQHAAGQCAAELADLVGEGILRGRLETESQRRALDEVLRNRHQQALGIAGDVFSPFGPPGLLDHLKPDGNGKSLHPGLAAAVGRFP